MSRIVSTPTESRAQLLRYVLKLCIRHLICDSLLTFPLHVLFILQMKLVSFKNRVDQIIVSCSKTHLQKDFMSI